MAMSLTPANSNRMTAVTSDNRHVIRSDRNELNCTDMLQFSPVQFCRLVGIWARQEPQRGSEKHYRLASQTVSLGPSGENFFEFSK